MVWVWGVVVGGGGGGLWGGWGYGDVRDQLMEHAFCVLNMSEGRIVGLRSPRLGLGFLTNSKSEQ